MIAKVTFVSMPVRRGVGLELITKVVWGDAIASSCNCMELRDLTTHGTAAVRLVWTKGTQETESQIPVMNLCGQCSDESDFAVL